MNPDDDYRDDDDRDYHDDYHNETPAQAIRTPQHAAMIVDLIVTAEERAARIKASCALMVKRAESDHQYLLERHADELRTWAAANLDPGRKSVQLPTGVLSFRARPAGPCVVDEGAALAWSVENCPRAVRVEHRLRKSPLYEYVAETGEVPPGVELLEAGESFSIRGPK